MLGFEGAPARARWLPDDAATALLTATPDQNTLPEFTGSAITTILAGLGEVRPEVNRRAGEFAAELRDAHRRVRRTVDQAVRGLTVTPAGDGDILGVLNVYLPAQTQEALPVIPAATTTQVTASIRVVGGLLPADMSRAS